MNQKLKKSDRIIFFILLFIYTGVLFVLFYRQCIGNEDYYFSDMKAYVLEAQGLDSGFSFPYPIFFKLSALLMFFTSPYVAVAVATTLLNSAAVITGKYYLDKIVERSQIAGKWGFFLSTIMTYALFFMSMQYSPKGHGFFGFDYIYRFLGIYSPTPWHNATYLAVRPFTIITFFVFCKILQEYEKKINWKDNILFGIMLLISTLTKPSFTFILVPAAGLVMLFRLMKSKFKNWQAFFKLGIFFIPTFLVLLYQFFGVFDNTTGEDTGIGIILGGSWQHYSLNIPLSVIMGMMFPIVVLFFNWKQLKDNREYRFSWQIWAVGFITFLFFYEKGFREVHANFCWGYMHGMFFTYMTSIIMMLLNTFKHRKKWFILCIEWGTFLIHLICGINYFLYFMTGARYTDF